MKKIELKKIFEKSQNIAIVGLSSRSDRTSNRIGRYLKEEAGYNIIPVNPNEDSILGETSWPSLTDIPSDIKIDIVNVFRRPEHLESIAAECVQRGVGFFWAQLGVSNDKAAEILQKAEVPYVMNRCIFVEHQQIFFK